jgi:dihydroorotate dehydrogenase
MLEKFILPIIEQLDAETEHLAMRDLLSLLEVSPIGDNLLAHLTYQEERFSDKRLHVTIGGVTFENPLIVGAGWDKVGCAVGALWQLGFAGVEVGSILARAYAGNLKPRHFILAPGVPLNRYGFNTVGMEAVAQNLERYRERRIPIGINVGKNGEISEQEAPEAYALVVRRLYRDGAYYVINVSSPGTPGLRALQGKEPLSRIVQSVNKAMEEMGGRRPLFVKIAPDLSYEAIDDVIQIVVEHGLTGIIATNTTNNPEVKAKYGGHWRDEMGGLSGDDTDFRCMSTDSIRHIYKVAGRQLTIIGAGGIKDVDTALEKIRAGATAVQIVAALDAEGPLLPGKITRGIAEYLERENIQGIDELVGVEAG